MLDCGRLVLGQRSSKGISPSLQAAGASGAGSAWSEGSSKGCQFWWEGCGSE
jgi:hypothetical protein